MGLVADPEASVESVEFYPFKCDAQKFSYILENNRIKITQEIFLSPKFFGGFSKILMDPKTLISGNGDSHHIVYKFTVPAIMDLLYEVLQMGDQNEFFLEPEMNLSQIQQLKAQFTNLIKTF